MTTEQFTLDQFKAALPKEAVYKDFAYGEHRFSIPLGKAELVIRSSIGQDGIARSTGDDSIRFVLLYGDRVLGKPPGDWTNRTPGWERRLIEKINYMISLRQQAGDCTKCGAPLVINLVQKAGNNYGKTCAWCPNGFDHKQWKVLDINKPCIPLDQFSFNGTRPRTLLDVKPKETLPLPLPEIKPMVPVPQLPASEWDVAISDEIPGYKVSVPNTKMDLSFLNEYQRAVVENLGKGISRIDAVPGSGKTRCLETLVAYMILNGIHPSRIVCLTFASKAASEMRIRIARTIWPGITDHEIEFFKNPRFDDPTSEFSEEWVKSDPIRLFLVKWVCTVHALCLRLLKEWYGPQKKMNVLEGDFKNKMKADQLIKDSLLELKWKESPKSVKHHIGTAIANLVDPYRSEQFFHDLILDLGGPTYRASDLAEIYSRYMDFMRKNGLVDFDMMQAEVIRLIHTSPLFVQKIQTMFDYVLNDESQDENGTQYEIVSCMAARCKNLSFIGDEDQLLYAWRGAVPTVMTEGLDKTWGTVTTFPLAINYRSEISIVKLASAFIKPNYAGDKIKYLKPYGHRPGAGEGKKPEALYLDDFDSLCRVAVERIAESDPGEWFILSRTRAECAAIHTALVAAGIPSVNKSGGLLFGAEHIRKVIAYAQLVIDYNGARDNLDILGEVANVASKDFISSVTRRRHSDDCPYRERLWGECDCPIIMKEGKDHSHTRYYGKESIQQAGSWNGIYQQSQETRFDRATKSSVPTMKARGASDLIQFVESCEKYANSAPDCLRFIIDRCVMPWLMVERGITRDDPSEGSELEDFALVVNMAQDGMTVEDFLKEVDRLTNSGKGQDDKDSVILGTVHWAKGAERPKVIVNMTRMPIVPPQKSEEELVTSRPATTEEERCIAYVAITRAKQELYVLASHKWLGKDLPNSIFFGEIKTILEEKWQ